MRLTWCFVLILSFGKCFGLEYKGYRIYQVISRSNEQVDDLLRLSETYSEFDFLNWNEIVNSTAHVIVSPSNFTTFEGLLLEYSLDFKVINNDLSQTIIEQQTFTPRTFLTKLGFAQQVSFKKYFRYHEISDYFDNLAKKYRNIVSVETIGKSYNNRDIKTITITDGTPGYNKKIIFIDAGIHAREWLATATALYVIYQLVEKFAENQCLLKNYKWIVLPVVNPDGYEYTHKTDRLWRKTRKPNINPKCPGTDANRNFDYHWGGESKSKEECGNTYHGPNSFSEPETRAVRDLMHRVGKNCKMYITLHSFGRYILLPWSSEWAVPKDYLKIEKVARAGYDAILYAKKQMYMIGNAPRVLNKATGTSMDYAHGIIKIPVAITVELANGGTGFDPSKEELEGLAEEGWIGIKAMAKNLQETYP